MESRSASGETGVVETVGWGYGLEIEAKDREKTLKDGSNVKERRYPAENSGILLFAFAALVSVCHYIVMIEVKDCLGTWSLFCLPNYSLCL